MSSTSAAADFAAIPALRLEHWEKGNRWAIVPANFAPLTWAAESTSANPDGTCPDAFKARFDACLADATIFAAMGFVGTMTGGGCTANALEFKDGWQVLITNDDLSMFVDPAYPEDAYHVGLHGPDGEYLDNSGDTAATASEIAEKAKVYILAHRFAEILKEWATPEEWSTMRATNRANGPGSPVCASHDFCDANMAMVQAFEEVFGRPDCITDGEDKPEQAEADRLIWISAWDIAKPLFLTAAEGEEAKNRADLIAKAVDKLERECNKLNASECDVVRIAYRIASKIMKKHHVALNLAFDEYSNPTFS
jgi:hypothetical protein